MRKIRNPILSCNRARRGAAIFLSVLFIFFGNLSCGREKDQGKVHHNSPPAISLVQVLPENPDATKDLNPVIRSQDPDGDPVTYQYQWMKNGEEIPGENKSVLTSRSFKKGDLISLKVVPSDGKVEGKPAVSDSVRILNSPPRMQEVRIEPRTASVTSNLKATVKSADPDQDFVYYTYRWDKNGAVLSEERGDVLEKGKFKKGDSITVTVIPDDREVQGPSHRSDPIIISNSSPVITSTPSTSAEANRYSYQVKANDPDGDRVSFVLKSRPPGMEIGKETGLIRWEIRKEIAGTHSVEIEASDEEGARSIQRYTLVIEFK